LLRRSITLFLVTSHDQRQLIELCTKHFYDYQHRKTQHPDPHHLYKQWCLPVSAGVLPIGTTDERNSELIRAVTTKLQQLTEKPPYFCEGF
jgi:hypothetical protein